MYSTYECSLRTSQRTVCASIIKANQWMLLGQTVLFTVSSLQFVTGLLRLRIRASFRTEEPWKCSHSSYYILSFFFFCFWRDTPLWARASSLTRFLDHTQRHTTVGRTPLNKWSARTQRPLSDKTKHSQQTSMPPGGIRTNNLNSRAAADLRLYRAAAGTGLHFEYLTLKTLN